MNANRLPALLALALSGSLQAAPVNDNFANATALSGTAVDVAVDLQGATREVGEPFYSPPPPESAPVSVWYSWTAPATGTVFLQCPTIYHKLSIYTGSSLATLTQVGTDPYHIPPPPFPRQDNYYWLLNATAGTTYKILYRSEGNSPWNPVPARLSIYQAPMPPANDNFANATALPASAAPTNLTAYTYGADHEASAGEPDLSDAFFWGMPFPTVWYSFTPNFNGFVDFQTSAATCPHQVDVFSGSNLAQLTLVSSNSSPGPDGKTIVRWKCVSGTPYRIRVASSADYQLVIYGDDPWGRCSVTFRKLTPTGVGATIAEARARLENQSPGCVQAADTLLQQALASVPSEANANFLRALTRLALLGESPAFKALVTTMTGDATPSLDPHDGQVTLAYDAEDDPVLPATSNPQELINWLNNSLLPELAAIRAHLNLVPSNYTTSLTGAETGGLHVEIDHADVKALTAATHALEMLVHFFTTCDLSLPLQNLVAWDKTGMLSAEQMRAIYVNLLRFSATNRRTQFRQQFTQVRLAGESAINFARNSRVQPLLHLWDTADILPADEQAAIADAALMETSFDGATVTLGRERVNLSKFVSATASLRDWLPGFSRDAPVMSTLPDPTFGGIFPDMDEARGNSLLHELGSVVDLGTFASFVGHLLADLVPADQARDADPDKDRRTNFEEYSFGGDPQRPDPGNQVVATVQTSGANVTNLRISFSRRRDLTDVNYVVAVSNNMLAWDRTGATVTPVGAPVPNEDGLTETVTCSIQGLSGANPPRFVRLEANLIAGP